MDDHVPAPWRDAAADGGRAAIRKVRSRAEYEAWYPTFADSGLAVATWPVAYGGLDLSPDAGAAWPSRSWRRTTSAGSTRSA